MPVRVSILIPLVGLIALLLMIFLYAEMAHSKFGGVY